MLDITIVKYRKEPVKQTKFIRENSNSNLVNSKIEKAYDYYICDYCKEEIRLDLKERSGGLTTFPHSLTKCGELKLALCNKCLKNAIDEFET